MGVADGSAVVSHNVWNFVLAELLLGDLEQFESCLSIVNAHWLESSLDVVEDAEVLAGLWDLEHIHQAEWVAWVSSCSVVNFDVGIFVSADLDCLLAGESVSESVAEQDSEWDAFSQLVGSSGWAGGEHSSKFVQAPVAWCVHSLQMLLWSSCLHKVPS